MNRIERVVALSSIWAAAREVYPYFDRLEIGWDEAYRDYLSRVMDESDNLKSWLLLAEFMRLLNDGHTTAVLPRALTAARGHFPYRFTQLGDRFLITEAPCRSALLREATGIDGLSMAELVALLDRWQYTAQGHPYKGRLEKWLPLMLPGREHVLHTDSGDLPFSFPEDPGSRESASEPDSSQPWQPLAENMRMFEPQILYVRMDDMQHRDHAAAFQSVLAQYRPRAVIFDIRRNMGGMTLCGAEYAQPFFEGSFGGCRKWTQSRSAVDAASNSQLSVMSPARRQRLLDEGTLTEKEFRGAQAYADRTHVKRYRDNWESSCEIRLPDCPVLLLTSHDTLSAAEDFTAFFKSNRRGLILGEATYGSTGSPLLLRLPEDGGAQIVSVGYELADGTPFIGCGIQPDIPCRNSMEDWRIGHDRQLDAALDVLRDRLRGF